MSLLPPQDEGFCARNAIFFEDQDYANQFLSTTQDLLGQKLSTASVIDRWAALLDSIEMGYNACPPELEDALEQVREPIDSILLDAALNGLAEHRKFAKVIQQLDNKFIELTFEKPAHPEDFTWYQQRVLKKAGPEYINFLSADLRMKIELIK